MSRQQKQLLLILLIPAFVSLLAISSVNIILPAVASSLGAGSGSLQLVISGYSLVFGVMLVPAGRAGDVLGRGRLFTVGLLLFGFGSLACGLAPDITTLNLARIVMGLGAGLFNPQITGMIQQYYGPEMRGRTFGLLGAIIGISVAMGPIVTGLLIAWLGPGVGWRLSFLINVPFALVGAWAARRTLPGGQRQARADLDPVGMGLLTMGMVLIMIPLCLPGASVWVWLLALSGIGLLAVWVFWERYYAAHDGAPMVDLKLFRIPSFAFGTLAISVHFLGYTAVWVIVAQYVQLGLGRSALASGLIGLPAALLSAVSSAAAGKRITRMGRVLVLWGMLACVLGMLVCIAVVYLQASAGWSLWWLALTLGVLGFGQGMIVSPNQALSLADVPVEHAGAAAGVTQTGQRIGASFGIAAITGVAFFVAAGHGWHSATQVGLVIETAVIALAASVAGVDLYIAKRRKTIN